MENINSDINRLRLHDSHLEKIVKSDNHVKIEFDWAYLSNYKEKKIHDGIVIGKSTLEITGYTKGIVRLDFKGSVGFENKTPIEIPISSHLIDDWEIILDNEINDIDKKIKISGFYNYENISCWIDWTFEYQKAELKWDTFILHEDWKKGVPLNKNASQQNL